MARKQRFAVNDEAARRGPYDEFPMFPPGIDPQIHISRNDRPQPFFLMCEHDTLLVTMSGGGRVEFVGGPVRYHTLAPGDFVYVPAGTPHRIVPEGECVQLRYRPEFPGLEGVAWYCDGCGKEVARDVWDTADELPQEGYLRATTAFNADPAKRTCTCGKVHPPVDLGPYRWAEVAAEVRKDLAATKDGAKGA